MAISAIAQLALNAVPAAGKLVSAIQQNQEARKLQERGPDELAPAIRQALNRSRLKANATVTPAYTAQKALMDENVADAAQAIKQTSNSAAEVIAGVNSASSQRGRALREALMQDQSLQERRDNQLTEVELFAGQQQARNREIWQQDINRMLGARDANLYGAANDAASAVALAYDNPFATPDNAENTTKVNTGTVDTYDPNGNLIASKANQAFFNNVMADSKKLAGSVFGDSQSEYKAPLATIQKINDTKRA